MAYPNSAGVAFPSDYDGLVKESLQVTGDSMEYYARERIRDTRRQLQAFDTTSILDYGCGNGLGTALLCEAFPEASRVLGVDISGALVERAHKRCSGSIASFEVLNAGGRPPNDDFDLVYCNGVFHHIPADDRFEAAACMLRALRVGGRLSFWENNPLNPGTRWVMSRNPSDRDAELLTPWSSTRLLRSVGFAICGVRSRFYFPRWLRWLRPAERVLSAAALGGQYQIVAERP